MSASILIRNALCVATFDDEQTEHRNADILIVGNRIAKYDTRTGRLITYWGMFGTAPGMIDRPHFLSVDSEGNLYLAQWNLTKSGVDKYVPRPDADPARLVGQPLVLK